MNIAVFIKKTTFHAGYGGLEVQNKLLCEGLASRNHIVTVFSPKLDVTDLEKTENGVKYIFVNSEYKYFMSQTNLKSWFNQSVLAFKKIHSVTPFSIAIGQSSAAVGILSRKKELKIKVISISHGSTLGELKTFYINNFSLLAIPRLINITQYCLRQYFGRQRHFILASDAVVAVSSAVMHQIISETFVSPEKIRVINNGIVPFVSENSTQKLSKKLVYMGQLTKDKGVGLFLDLLKDLRFKDFELDVIGDGPMKATFLKETTESNNVLKINMFGKISHDELVAKLKTENGAMLLFPTRRIEGFPMVLVEAMFASLPIVAYNLGGVEDAVLDGETGYVIPFENRDLFINRVLELASDPVKMDYMGKNALRRAQENFSMDTMLNKYETLITEVLK